MMKQFVAVLLLVFHVSQAYADIDPTSEYKIMMSDDYDNFGLAVAVDGDTAVIGAPGDEDNGKYAGAAYVFVRAADGTWHQQQKLLAADGAAWDSFGWSVAVDGDTVLIGANDDDDQGSSSGSAYVFVRGADGTWQQKQKLTGSDGTLAYYFGCSVAVSGNIALIGAEGDANSTGDFSGSAYVFVRGTDGTWQQKQKLTAADKASGDYFGYSLSLSAATALIGAHGKDSIYSSPANIGAAYLFVKNTDGTWTQQKKLTSLDAAANDSFGNSVSLDGNTALIGAYHDTNNNGEWAGSAYIFVRAEDGNWPQQQKLTADDGGAEEYFGWSVALDGDTALISSYHDSNENGQWAGSVYVFVRSPDGVWIQQAKLTADDGAPDDLFGRSVSLSGGIALIGSSGDDDQGMSSGSAYIYTSTHNVPSVNMEPIYKLLLLKR